MSRSDELEPFSESINEVFTKMGLPDPVVMARLAEEWEELAGSPWVGRSKPLYVRGRTLVVEASAPSMVAFLRYGEASLVAALKDRFGADLIAAVEVVAPGRG